LPQKGSSDKTNLSVFLVLVLGTVAVAGFGILHFLKFGKVR
jgi:hypothetical protein